MTPNAVRLTLGIALIPLLPGLCWITYFALDEFMPAWSEEACSYAGYMVCAALAVLVWLLLWRQAVQWTRRRRLVTGVLALALLLSPVSVWCRELIPRNTSLERVLQQFCWMAPIFAYSLWLAGTAWAWRSDRLQVQPGFSTAEIGGEGPAWCPQCGYSLRGLHEVRCPECGWRSTVDDIVARSIAQVLAIP